MLVGDIEDAVDISKIILLNNYCYILIGGGNWW